MDKYLLKLYITGQTTRSADAIARLSRIFEEKLKDHYEITIIDVMEKPELAEEDKVLATPTLIKYSPPPCRRIVGDLSDTGKVLSGLGLSR